MDEAIWGWLWPKGQMALWLDTQMSFGVTTQVGRMYAELFQILYVSYYFWGNAIGIFLAYKYFYFCVYKKNKGTRKRSANEGDKRRTTREERGSRRGGECASEQLHRVHLFTHAHLFCLLISASVFFFLSVCNGAASRCSCPRGSARSC